MKANICKYKKKNKAKWDRIKTNSSTSSCASSVGVENSRSKHASKGHVLARELGGGKEPIQSKYVDVAVTTTSGKSSNMKIRKEIANAW